MKMKKYARLSQYLTTCTEQACRLSFKEIEQILGFPLPEGSKKYASVFWSNSNQGYALIWLQAGRIVTQYSIEKRFVVFVRKQDAAEKYLYRNHTSKENTEAMRVPCETDARQGDFNCQELILAGERYFGDMQQDPHARYLSWEHCYAFFQENRFHPSEQTLDFLCLHLAWYLASWGMLRGGAFLLQKDYRIHMPVVQRLISAEYVDLNQMPMDRFTDSATQKKIFDLGEEIEKIYQMQTKSAENLHGSIASGTLITKILLGTVGCAPAYDRYFKKGLSISGIASQKFAPASVAALSQYYLRHMEDLENFRIKISKGRVTYTPMKVLDMCIWQLGYESEQKSMHAV